MATALQTLTTKLAQRFEISDGSDVMSTLKATAFKGNVSDSQMTALLIVANQYGLNPWTKEIYAFPDRQNGIVPIVGVDGWARIINDNPAFDGMEFDIDDEKCTCRIYRKDRSRPTEVTEYMSECYRDITGPWKTHPKRMLRHKAMIQCARLAFGFTGIFDKDEAERIIEDENGFSQSNQNKSVIDTKHVELISDEELEQVKNLIELSSVDESKILAYAGNVDSLNKIPKSMVEKVINRLNLSLDQAQQETYNETGEEIPL
ncbi:phage recombination protein Bet [Pasteurella multocida]|nr:phage recombination protein Bet [Pasteurella multocida]